MAAVRPTLLSVALSLALSAGCAQQQAAPRLPVRENAPASDSAFDKAADRPPTTKTLYVMAKLYAGQGKDAEAEAALKRVLVESPKFTPAYCELAEAQLRQGRAEDAVRTLSAGLKVAPRDPVLLNDLGMCHLLKKDYERALTSFRAASAANPSDARYRSNTAVSLGMLGRYDEALVVYAQVVSPADAARSLPCSSIDLRNSADALAWSRRDSQITPRL
jgi:Flp pilus assembly protein TadD